MKLIINTSLFILALALTVFFLPFAIVFALVRGIYKRKVKDWYNSTESYFFKMAYAVDKFGNVLMAPLFNTLMLRNETQLLLFGNPDETISSCLGRNQMHINLTFIGNALADLLDTIDTDHCYRAAQKFLWDKA